MIRVQNAAQRSYCEWCKAEPGDPCTDFSGAKIEVSHAQRWAKYKQDVQQQESVWQLATDSYQHYGLRKGDRFAGVPHWFDKTTIVVTLPLTNPDLKAPATVINCEELYWVDWFEIDRRDY